MVQLGMNFIATFVGVGGFLLGYDVGIISGVLAMDSFKEVFKYDDWSKGWIVTAFVIGCCAGGVSSSFIAERWGRRSALATSSLVFVVGGIAQVFCTTLPQLYAARVVSGVAVGISSAITPFFNSELAPAERRGMLVTLNQIFMTGGIMVAFWVNWALQDVSGSFAGWRIAIALQCVPGVVLFLGCLIVPRSPRWLVQQGRTEEALASLLILRGARKRAEVELEEIVDDVEQERKTPSANWSDFCTSGVTLRRVVTGCCLQMFQMLTGINSVMYYAPAIFESCGFNLNEQLLATGGTGIVNFLATWCAFWLLDRVGRRSLLISGAVGMALSMGVRQTRCPFAAAHLKSIASSGPGRPWPALRHGGRRRQQRLGISRRGARRYQNPFARGGICLRRRDLRLRASQKIAVCASRPGRVFGSLAGCGAQTVCFAYSWGPCVWCLCSEIFPTAQRAKGVSITTTTNWTFGIVISLFVPVLQVREAKPARQPSPLQPRANAVRRTPWGSGSSSSSRASAWSWRASPPRSCRRRGVSASTPSRSSGQCPAARATRSNSLCALEPAE